MVGKIRFADCKKQITEHNKTSKFRYVTFLDMRDFTFTNPVEFECGCKLIRNLELYAL